MSKNKSNKQNDNVNNFHNDPEVEKLMDIEVKTEQKTFNPDEFPDISSTIHMTNPGEEIKLHTENFIEAPELKQESEPVKKEEVKVNIINVADKPAKTEPNKENLKVSIVDISHKKSDKSHSKSKLFSLIKNPFNSKVDLLNVGFDHKDFEKALDSMIYVGGGFIAVTSLTSKALANIGSLLIKK